MSIATTAVGFAGVATIFTYIAPLLTEVTGFAAPAVSVLLPAYGAGSFAGNITAGRLTDRSFSATVCGVFGALAGVLALFPFLLVWQPSAVFAVLALGSLATATIAPLQSLILKHAGATPTLAVSVNVGALNLGAAMGSVLGGAIVAADGLRWTGLAGALLSLLGLALLPRHPPQHNGTDGRRRGSDIPASRGALTESVAARGTGRARHRATTGQMIRLS
ncbi:MFS transporter [Nocardia sp. NPDC019395]|uniref:MFS transporter n=1 Tax=Nocardia sp. NPDC019395 TaxID=3154686 RepID=UPI0033ED2321